MVFFVLFSSLCFPLCEICTQINILCIHNSHLKRGLILFLLSFFFLSSCIVHDILFAFRLILWAYSKWYGEAKNRI